MRPSWLLLSSHLSVIKSYWFCPHKYLSDLPMSLLSHYILLCYFSALNLNPPQCILQTRVIDPLSLRTANSIGASQTIRTLASGMDGGNCGQLMRADSLGSLPGHAARGPMACRYKSEPVKCLWEYLFSLDLIQPLHIPERVQHFQNIPLIFPSLFPLCSSALSYSFFRIFSY